MAWKVVHKGEAETAQCLPGSTQRILIGSHTGAIHLEISEVTIEPQAEIAGHRHPFEESFYVLAGNGVVTIGSTSYALGADDFGLVPLGHAHAWANPHDQPLELLRVRSPQPRHMRGEDPTYPTDDATPHREGIDPPRAVAAPHRPVGRFDSSQLPPPGPLNMKGYRGPRIGGVSIWMLVDELVGAIHHTMFIVEFESGGDRRPAGDHFHPFEEAYYFLAGSAIAHLEGEDIPVSAGDIVFCGVNDLHGYSVTSEEPMRWIEVQSPAPPPNGATFFPDDWHTDADGHA